MQEPRIIFAEPLDGDEEDYDQEEEIALSNDEDDIADQVPVFKRRKLDPEIEAEAKQEQQLMLTKNFKLEKEFLPVYTGGAFKILRDQEHALAINDSKLTLIKIRSGQQVGELEQENEEILNFAVSPNQQLLATTNKQYLVRVFKLPDLSTVEDDPKDEHKDEATASTWTPECVQTFKITGSLGMEVCFDPSSRFLAVGTSDSQVKVYDVVKGFQTHNFLGHRGVIVQLAFYPQADSLRLLSAGEDFCVKIWDMVLNKEVHTLRESKGRITCFNFSADAKTLIVGAKDGRVCLYNAHDNYRLIAAFSVKELGVPQEEEINAVQYLSYSAETSFLVIGGSQGSLAVLDLATQEVCYVEQNHVQSEVIHLSHILEPVSSTVQRKNRQSQIVCLNQDQNLFIYSVHRSHSQITGKPTLTLEKISSKCLFLDEVIDLKFIKPENTRALVCTNSETLKLLDFESHEIEMYPGHTDIILCLDTCPQKNLFLTGSKDNEVRLWRYTADALFQQRLKCMAVFKGHAENISSVCFAPRKGLFFASVGQDNTLKVWNMPEELDSQEIVKVKSAQMTIMAHQKYINSVRVAPNDKVLATSSQDKTIKIWDSQNLTLKNTLKGHQKGVWDIQFSPADQLLVSASGDKMLKVWNLSTGQCVATLQGHTTALVKVAWLNMGLQVASASVEGVVKVWNVKKQVCQNTFEMHDEKIWALDFAEIIKSDNEGTTLKLLTGGSDSKVRLWQDSTVEEDKKQKEERLELIEQEQTLSKLLRDNDLFKATLLAFKLNKLRDFYHALSQLISGRPAPPRPHIQGMMVQGILPPTLHKSQDPVLSLIANTEDFETVTATKRASTGVAKGQEDQEKVTFKIVSELMKQDKKKLLETVKKLNARQEYAQLAQTLLSEILPRFDYDELIEEFKETNLLRDLLEVTAMYAAKHYNRVDGNLKRTFYLNYVVSQMSLQAEEEEKIVEVEATPKEAPVVAKKRSTKQQRKNAAKAAKASQNLFA